MSAGRRFEQAPDGIVPLVGYRLWWVVNEDDAPVLFPLNDRTPEWSGATRGWVSASCRFFPELSVSPDGELVEGIPHRVPGESCTCGFYAMKELDRHLLLMASTQPGYEPSPTEGRLVAGRVELAGKIVEHELGYRAERARIVEMIPVRGEERVVEAIARRAGVPVGPPVKVPRTPIRERMRYLRLQWAINKAESRREPKSGEILLYVLWGCWVAFRVLTFALEEGGGP